MYFTTMSANVLEQPYKINISMCIKRALIGMCIDIIIREKVMARGILDLIKAFNEFGVSKAFNDNELLTK
jgi:hypothetical protein